MTQQTIIEKNDGGRRKNLAFLVYALQTAGFFTGGITTLIGLIINYIKREAVIGSWVESHFSWQIRTFWWAFLWYLIGSVTTWLLIGFVILGINTLWLIYRIAAGWLRLNNDQPAYTDN